MARYFNEHQRLILGLLAYGKCQKCNDPLGKFHSDHVISAKNHGETTLRNGQALCEKCNLEKSANNADYRPDFIKRLFDKEKPKNEPNKPLFVKKQQRVQLPTSSHWESVFKKLEMKNRDI